MAPASVSVSNWKGIIILEQLAALSVYYHGNGITAVNSSVSWKFFIARQSLLSEHYFFFPEANIWKQLVYVYQKYSSSAPGKIKKIIHFRINRKSYIRLVRLSWKCNIFGFHILLLEWRQKSTAILTKYWYKPEEFIAIYHTTILGERQCPIT